MTVSAFRKHIWDFYEKNRRSFPWRDTHDPYAILVSELMLQQTQTHRVVPKYLNWLQLFPTVRTLSQASLTEVLLAWSGLGYNRRVKYLWEAASQLVASNKSEIPDTYEQLRILPGIGEYTANAVLAFAFEQPTIVLETNIRTALLHHFYKDGEKVSDKELKELAAKVLDKTNPRNWYYALMDYGSWLKSEGIHHFQRQKSYTKQKPFKGSERFVRGYLLRETLIKKELLLSEVILAGYEKETIEKVANDLVNEGLVKRNSSNLLTVV